MLHFSGLVLRSIFSSVERLDLGEPLVLCFAEKKIFQRVARGFDDIPSEPAARCASPAVLASGTAPAILQIQLRLCSTSLVLCKTDISR